MLYNVIKTSQEETDLIKITSLSKFLLLFCGLFFITSAPASALTFQINANTDVIGEIQHQKAKSGDTLATIGRRYDIGLNEMMDANPTLDPMQHLSQGLDIVVPSKFILPPGERKGIVINLAELRLYYFLPDNKTVLTEPVGIGREGGWNTPLGTTKITKKETDPYWHPTASVRTEAAKNGTPIPWAFPPGPDNPLGKYVLRLGWLTYLIHGTNRPDGVGARVSAGCIRMLPEDIKELYDQVPIGTKVRVIDEPFKVGWKGKSLFFEAHRPLKETASRFASSRERIVNTVLKAIDKQKALVRWQLVKRIINDANGMPQWIGLQ